MWKYQVEEGSLETVVCSNACLVIAEHWPSWGFALKTVGVKDLKTILGTSSARIKAEIKSTHIGDSLTTWDALKKSWTVEGVKWSKLFIQGSTSFVEDVVKTMEWIPVVSVSAITPVESGIRPCRFESMDSRLTISSHKGQGGITKGQWTLHSQNKVEVPSNGVKCLLGHITTPIESGQPIVAGSRALGNHDRKPVGACKIRVHDPSVYTRNELVSRLLTDRELMDAYDMEVPDQKVLRAFTTSNGNTSSCAYVNEAPLKVLLAATRGILVSESIMLQDEVDKVLANIPAGDELMNDDDAEDRTSVASDVAPCAGPDDVAVNYDDAIVDTEKWDRWSVDNFEVPDNVKLSLVCQHGIFSQSHVRFFDALRALLLRRCRRNAFKGLCKYLPAKHSDELVPCTVSFGSLSRKQKLRQKRR